MPKKKGLSVRKSPSPRKAQTLHDLIREDELTNPFKTPESGRKAFERILGLSPSSKLSKVEREFVKQLFSTPIKKKKHKPT